MIVIGGLVKSKKWLLLILFSITKMVAAAGQTVFSVRYGLNYIFANTGRNVDSISTIAGFATLLVVAVTRVPAMYVFLNSEKSHHSPVLRSEMKVMQRYIYHVLVSLNIISGLFSSVGAYLGLITIIEFILLRYHLVMHQVHAQMLIQGVAVFGAIACYLSYYSFNISKAKNNAEVFVRNFSVKKISMLKDRIAIRTFLLSFLNLVSLPFISYFLTKHALFKMPYLSDYLSSGVIEGMAIFAAIAALISSLTTTLVSMYEYLSRSHVDKTMKSKVSMFKCGTYVAGIVDCSANALGGFMGVINVSNDIMSLTGGNNLYVVLMAIGCGLSSGLLNFNFSVRQGFNDVEMLFSGSVDRRSD